MKIEIFNSLFQIILEYIGSVKVIKRIFYLFLIVHPQFGNCQSIEGRVVSSETNEGISFVNVGIIGKASGTVSNEQGIFRFRITGTNLSDSLRFSMIGYKSKTIVLHYFVDNPEYVVILTPATYRLSEVRVVYNRKKEKTIGYSILTNKLNSGFAYNNLGAELGISSNVDRKVILKSLSLNITECSFDTVTYRFNIYNIENSSYDSNVLTSPIYITFLKQQVPGTISFDLSKYSIILKGNLLFSLQLYKELGEGILQFNTDPFKGSTYFRKSSEDDWKPAMGAIGLFMKANIIE